ncbi:hypothetical protein [Cellulomonas alba]|uniref:Lipoprotein n=1 Tax=Cellulomonas alba TaxID=3053467 RepID=A0ABT7SG83_9CELL|nr:hypothetical protein [Cellulomonas alba]MDM7855208.1 hypothetical protein [Cellulomonas alba]
MSRSPRLRSAFLTGAAVVTIAALAGCGGGKPAASEKEPAASPSASAAAAPSTAPTDPAPAGTSDAPPSAPPSAASTPATTKAASGKLSLTSAQIKKALLKPSDLGSGWVKDTSGLDLFGDDGGDDGDARITPTRCEKLGDALDASSGKPTGRGHVSYMTADGSAIVGESVETIKGTSPADIAALEALFTQCPQMIETDSDGTTVTMRITPLAFPKIGDASTAIQLTMTAGGMQLPFTMAFVAKGNEQISVMALGADAATVAKAAKAATKRIAAAG